MKGAGARGSDGGERAKQQQVNTPRVHRALVDSTNARRTRGVFPCRVRRALVNLANVLLISEKTANVDNWRIKYYNLGICYILGTTARADNERIKQLEY